MSNPRLLQFWIVVLEILCPLVLHCVSGKYSGIEVAVSKNYLRDQAIGDISTYISSQPSLLHISDMTDVKGWWIFAFTTRISNIYIYNLKYTSPENMEDSLVTGEQKTSYIIEIKGKLLEFEVSYRYEVDYMGIIFMSGTGKSKYSSREFKLTYIFSNSNGIQHELEFETAATEVEIEGFYGFRVEYLKSKINEIYISGDLDERVREEMRGKERIFGEGILDYFSTITGFSNREGYELNLTLSVNVNETESRSMENILILRFNTYLNSEFSSLEIPYLSGANVDLYNITNDYYYICYSYSLLPSFLSILSNSRFYLKTYYKNNLPDSLQFILTEQFITQMLSTTVSIIPSDQLQLSCNLGEPDLNTRNTWNSLPILNLWMNCQILDIPQGLIVFKTDFEAIMNISLHSYEIKWHHMAFKTADVRLGKYTTNTLLSPFANLQLITLLREVLNSFEDMVIMKPGIRLAIPPKTQSMSLYPFITQHELCIHIIRN